MSGEQLMNSLLNHASVDGSKSTVLRPLGWALVMLLPSVITSSWAGVPEWITIMFAIMLGFVVLLYLGAYIYFMRTDPDALRSEKYSLKKMEIQNTLIGDSDRGMEEVSLINRSSPDAILELQGSDNE